MTIKIIESFAGYADVANLPHAPGDLSDLAFGTNGLGGRRSVDSDGRDGRITFDLGEHSAADTVYVSMDLSAITDNLFNSYRFLAFFGDDGGDVREVKDDGKYGQKSGLVSLRYTSSTTIAIDAHTAPLVGDRQVNIANIAISSGVANRWEFAVKPSSSSTATDGRLIVYVDGVLEVDYTGTLWPEDSGASAGRTIHYVRFGNATGSSSNGDATSIAAVLCYDDVAGSVAFPLGNILIEQVGAADTELNSDDGDTSYLDAVGTFQFDTPVETGTAIAAQVVFKGRAEGAGNAALDIALDAGGTLAPVNTATFLAIPDYRVGKSAPVELLGTEDETAISVTVSEPSV